MYQSLLLFALFLSGSGDQPGDDARAVFTGIAADGTVLFGDRPSTVAPAGFRAADRLRLPPENVVAPFVSARSVSPPEASSPRLSPGSANKAETSGAAAGDPQACQRMRIRLAGLWRERRQGYAAARGQELKRDIRRLQDTMKARCGNWR